MAFEEVVLEDGEVIVIDNGAPDTGSQSSSGEYTDISINGMPSAPEKTGSYGQRFVDEIGDPDHLASTVMGIPRAAWGAMKGAYGAVKDLPQSVENIYNDPSLIAKNGPKAIGEVGKIMSRVNPLFFATGPAYDKLLSVIDPENFEPTTPEQDAAKVRGEIIMGAIPFAGKTLAKDGLGGVAAAGKFLKGKLGTEVIPAEVIPEIKAQFSDWKPPPSFEQSLTPGVRAKAMKNGRVVDPQTGQVTTKLNQAIENNRDLLDLPPQESLEALLAKKDAALFKAGNIVRKAEAGRQPLLPTQQTVTRVKPGQNTGILDAEGNPIVRPDDLMSEVIEIPPRYSLDTSRAEAFINGIKDPVRRAKANEFFQEKKTGFESQWDGSLETLHDFRKELTGSNPRAFERGLGDVNPDQSRISKLLTEDLNNMLDKSAPGYRAANAPASEALRLERIAQNRLGKAESIQAANEAGLPKERIVQEAGLKPEQQIAGPWQANINKAAKIIGGGLGAAAGNKVGGFAGAATGGVMGAALGGQAAPAMASVAGGIGGAAGGLQKALSSPVAQMMQGAAVGPAAGMMQQEALLPRDSESLNSETLGAFLERTATTPQAAIAQGLVSKLQKALQAQDMDTIEKIHSDMTRLFPDLFEPGVGVNGKVFYPDEQAKVMDNLKQLNRLGVVDSIHLAKQRNSFSNPQDSRVLPVKPAPKLSHDGKPRFYEGTRVYSY